MPLLLLQLTVARALCTTLQNKPKGKDKGIKGGTKGKEDTSDRVEPQPSLEESRQGVVDAADAVLKSLDLQAIAAFYFLWPKTKEDQAALSKKQKDEEKEKKEQKAAVVAALQAKAVCLREKLLEVDAKLTLEVSDISQPTTSVVVAAGSSTSAESREALEKSFRAAVAELTKWLPLRDKEQNSNKEVQALLSTLDLCDSAYGTLLKAYNTKASR